MAEPYLLDINILRFALETKDKHDNQSVDAAMLVSTLYEICHEIVMTIKDDSLIKKFIATEMTRNTGSYIVTKLLQVVSVSDSKYRVSDKEVDLEHPRQIPRKDIYLAKTAKAEGISLITEDERLCDAINASMEFNEIGIRAYNVKEMLSKLGFFSTR